MQVIISCVECGFEADGNTDKELMNKIVMWNHMQHEHPETAERIMRIYNHVPVSIYNLHTLEEVRRTPQRFVPRFA